MISLFTRGGLVRGDSIQAYEEKFKSYLGARYAVSFFKGRVALYAILKALGIQEGDEVILQGFTCVVVPNAVMYCGAKPVYVDIDPMTFNIDIQQVKKKLTSKTKAIIIQHTFGMPVDVDPIISLAKEHNLWVIEDSAHALGVKYKGKIAGLLGDVSFFSSQWSKPFSTGLGGLAVTNNCALGEALKKIQLNFNWPTKSEVGKLLTQQLLHEAFFNPSLYWTARSILRNFSRAGIFTGNSSRGELGGDKPKDFEKRMSNVQARFGVARLETIDAKISHRIRMENKYQQELSKLGIPSIPIPSWAEPVYLRYPLFVKNKGPVLELAKRNRIEVGSWFDSVLHPKGIDLKEVGYMEGECPVAERVVKGIINLPTHSRVKEKDFERIILFLRKNVITNEETWPFKWSGSGKRRQVQAVGSV